MYTNARLRSLRLIGGTCLAVLVGLLSLSPVHSAAAIGTSTTVAASANLVAAGSPVTLTARVTAASGAGPTGTITFQSGSTTLGAAALGTATLNVGSAVFATSALATGTHNITASYTGDAANQASVSAALSITVNASAGGGTGSAAMT